MQSFILGPACLLLPRDLRNIVSGFQWGVSLIKQVPDFSKSKVGCSPHRQDNQPLIMSESMLIQKVGPKLSKPAANKKVPPLFSKPAGKTGGPTTQPPLPIYEIAWRNARMARPHSLAEGAD
jgi:hypothetical protein